MVRQRVVLLVLVALVASSCTSEDRTESSNTPTVQSSAPSTVSVPVVDLHRTRMAFNWEGEEDGEDGGLFVLSMAEGASSSRLVTDTNAQAVSWSPDGTRVAFHSRTAGTTDIYVANADGTNVTQLTGTPDREAWPSWSPDGARLVFERIFGPDRRDLYAINADGTDEVRLTDRKGHDESASWSPDGSRIVFVSDRDDNPGDCDDDQPVSGICNLEIYVMGTDGTDAHRLTTNESVEGFPRFSPDGSRIVFHSNRDGNWEVYLMTADGSNQTNLTNRNGLDGHPCFSPDGTNLAFVSTQDGEQAIFQMNSDGSGVELIAGTRGGSYPAWSPGT